MKTLSVIAILTISGLFTLSSCSKKGDDVTPAATTQTPTTTKPTTTTTTTQSTSQSTGFSSKIDGKDFRPDLGYAKAVAPGNEGYYAIYGLDSKTSDVVMIALPYSALAGTWKLSYVNFGALSLGDGSDSFSTRYEPGDGTVTITNMTTTMVEGTFSFTAYSNKGVKRTITEGKFSVPFK
jgi:hypothetical protein